MATARDVPGFGSGAVDSDAPLVRTNPHTGDREVAYLRQCPGQTPTFRWIADGPTVAELVAAAHDRARRAVPAPTPAVNPPPVPGGTVNLGMWLAVDQAEPVSVTASAGGTWATVTATIERTTFDLGNGDVVTCDGAGTPLTDLATVEPGPCGYTYRRSTPPGQPHRVTITASWRVTYRSSAGDGTLPAITTSTTFDYPVREIQTIGIEG